MPISEFDLIQRYFTHPSQRDDVLLGVGDDAALLQVPPGMTLTLSVDMLVAGRHFPEDTPAHAIGYKALAVNLSDMAAMGAAPAWVSLALSLPEADEGFVSAFAEGFMGLSREHGVALVGGDTVRGPLCISVQIHGLLPQGQALRRNGAKVGDGIFVSGYLGDAAAGLAVVQGRLDCRDEDAHYLRQRLDYPSPRVALGLALRGIASAAIDISDGLAADLGHILTASGCGARLQLDALPLSEALRAALPEQQQAWDMALHGGDDYELCFTVPEQDCARIEQGIWPCPVRRIGTIVAEAGLAFQDQHGQGIALDSCGFDHFATR